MKGEREGGDADVGGGLFDGVGISSRVGNLGDFCVRSHGVRWSHGFVRDVTSLLVILLVMKEEREAPM